MTTLIYGVSRLLAWIGGAVLTLIAVMSVASITGRALTDFGLGPVPGDFELVEAGTALAVFCFLPWCQLKRGHAMVDIMWRAYPPAMRKALEIFTELLNLVIWVVLIWRMGVSMLEYMENGETTFILQMPVWWGYLAAMIPAVLGCFVYVLRLAEEVGLAQPPRDFQFDAGGH